MLTYMKWIDNDIYLQISGATENNSINIECGDVNDEPHAGFISLNKDEATEVRDWLTKQIEYLE